MAKKIVGTIKLQVPAGKATPGQALAALSQKGANIMEFCKAFNAKTQEMDQGVPTPTIITVYADRTFSFITKQPPVSYFLKKVTGLKKGSSLTGRDQPIGEITMAQVADIAEKKKDELNSHTLEAACRTIAGSARAMGLKVVE